MQKIIYICDACKKHFDPMECLGGCGYHSLRLYHHSTLPFPGPLSPPKHGGNFELCNDCAGKILDVLHLNNTEDTEENKAVEIVRCNECKSYQGVHDVKGCAPCEFWQCGSVMWNDYCSNGVKYKE